MHELMRSVHKVRAAVDDSPALGLAPGRQRLALHKGPASHCEHDGLLELRAQPRGLGPKEPVWKASVCKTCRRSNIGVSTSAIQTIL